jgi:3-phosphoshikimate 1-carboxyvinyltransferase
VSVDVGNAGTVMRFLPVRPRPLRAPAGHAFESYDDHQMVMAGAVLGLGVPGIEVLNVATVGKTFPDFTSLWEGLVRGDDS